MRRLWFALLALAGCDCRPSQTVEVCDKGHNYTYFIPMMVGKVMIMMPQTGWQCTESHVEHNPKYDEWLARHPEHVDGAT